MHLQKSENPASVPVFHLNADPEAPPGGRWTDRQLSFGLQVRDALQLTYVFYKWETELPLVEKYVEHTFLDTRYNGREYDPWETYYTDDDLSHKVYTKYEEDFKRFDY